MLYCTRPGQNVRHRVHGKIFVLHMVPDWDMDVESHHRILEELSRLLDSGKVRCHLTHRSGLTLDGLREAHRTIESGGSIGKTCLTIADSRGVGSFVQFKQFNQLGVSALCGLHSLG